MRTAVYNILLLSIILFFIACASSQSSFKVGKQYYDDGNFEQAIVELEKASVNDKSIYDRISAFEYLGEAYGRKGSLDKAVLSYKSAHDLMRVRIGEIIDLQKHLKSDKLYNPGSNNYNASQKVKKLSDELSKLNMRVEEAKVKIMNLK